jgi:formamidopyrimidine-DNA glycosylase
MPELPEVEVTRRGVEPYLLHQEVQHVVLRRAGLRWPFPPQLELLLSQKKILEVARRGKYLILRFAHGCLLIHLGMSGHLRILPLDVPAKVHDHIDIVFADKLLRMTDPRRFGAVLWHDWKDGDLEEHILLRKLGVEPLQDGFTAPFLHRMTRQRSAPIKQVLLAGDIVVGVGNIYACESLFKAGIHPKTSAARISLKRYEKLVSEIRATLTEAIAQGGSTLKDFIGVNGQSGYFQQNYFVYARTGQPCRICGAAIRQIQQGQRSTFYCQACQK